ncbi:hypothetical protein RAB80_013730 [Fusarium oxysporum f. sp. vasinfectum]|nr:hypothetical protein RAB80_013730 [Fusarium oxysporum f. sp. vasinfectum]KAK2927760.1 hypothetical protein FoTM2_012936 [Fusarium oxysporum f. sp. vasinfectum]
MNYAWQQNYNQKVQGNKRNYDNGFPEYEIGIGKTVGSNSARQIFNNGIPVRVLDRSQMPSNDCYRIHNTPNATQAPHYDGPQHTSNVVLRYDCFIPTGETYEFLPCAPYGDPAGILGFKQVRGIDTIMERYGNYIEEIKAFKPYKLLQYRGRRNDQPNEDDGHRFIYLAQNKPGEPVVGDCFIRLEEVHNRMRGDVAPYELDCQLALDYDNLLAIGREGSYEERMAAENKYNKLQQQWGGLLRFRCWTVRGVPCSTHENELGKKLFHNFPGKETADEHIELFRVWAEILRKSQGDKMAAKDFFGRYWDAIIPNDSIATLSNGMKIQVSTRLLQDIGFHADNLPTSDQRKKIKAEVYDAVVRVINAPRLKFKPQLPPESIIFPDEVGDLPSGWQGFQFNQNGNGWTTLETHPGGLYSILINRAVLEFLCSDARYKPLRQGGYDVPLQGYAQALNQRLDLCGHRDDTTTQVSPISLAAAKNGKRNPTQDKCVAQIGCSANVAMSVIYPGLYPNSAEAKKKRVAEWLHRSAFSYGGLTPGDLGSSQVANNLVLGSPETNTVMMRYEAFVKRLAIHSNQDGGDTVIVFTRINYPTLVGWNQDWVQNAQYTWLAPELEYRYNNSNTSSPYVSDTRWFYPMQRQTAMLFEALLDKSMEFLCWKWPCWDVNNAVAEALVESTGVDGDQEEVNQEDLEEMLNQDLNERDQPV